MRIGLKMYNCQLCLSNEFITLWSQLIFSSLAALTEPRWRVRPRAKVFRSFGRFSSSEENKRFSLSPRKEKFMQLVIEQMENNFTCWLASKLRNISHFTHILFQTGSSKMENRFFRLSLKPRNSLSISFETKVGDWHEQFIKTLKSLNVKLIK